MTSLERLKRAARMPEKSMLFFGADPVHTPATEDRHPVGCPACGGMTIDANGFPVLAALANGQPDPLPRGETTVFVCKCGRTHYKHLPGRIGEGNADIARAYGNTPEGHLDRTAEAVKQAGRGKGAGRKSHGSAGR